MLLCLIYCNYQPDSGTGVRDSSTKEQTAKPVPKVWLSILARSTKLENNQSKSSHSYRKLAIIINHDFFEVT